jgi:hypothetical protein
MREEVQPTCPDCEQLDRRHFLTVTGSVAVLGGLTPVLARAADQPTQTTKAAKPAEALIKELYAGLSAEQKQNVVYPWDHGGGGNATPTRKKMVNSAHFGKTIGKSYTKAQQELLLEILKSMCSGDDGFHQISRAGKWDGSGSFEGIGALIFGEPTDGKQFAMVFAGHHLTVRCDGNSEPGAGFGGPMYYGHSPNGYSPNNVWFYQTKSVLSVFDALNEEQRKKAVVVGKSPGEQEGSVRFRPAGEAHPGIACTDLTKDQRDLVEKVMRTVVSPYRKEDGDEVMDIVKANGGLEKVHLAFYQDGNATDNQRWHFWRLEGPGFVWNYRVLPHVHTFVNISKV